MHSTAKKVLSSAHRSNTTGVKRSGWRTRKARVFWEQSGQAQIPDQPVSNPRRPNHCSNWWTSKNAQNKYTATTSWRYSGKLQKLQDILQPRPNGKIKSTPLQTPAQVPRVHTLYKYAPDHSPVQTSNATAPRVAMNYAIPPRVVPVETNGNATEFVYPKRDIWNKQKTRPVKPTSPRQSPQLEALQKQARVADAGQLRTVSTPAQNTRSKTPAHWQRTLWSKDNWTGTCPGMLQNLHRGHAKTRPSIQSRPT